MLDSQRFNQIQFAAVGEHARIAMRYVGPANIFVTERGEVKILDFGLAEVVEVVEAAVSPGAAEYL